MGRLKTIREREMKKMNRKTEAKNNLRKIQSAAKFKPKAEPEEYNPEPPGTSLSIPKDFKWDNFEARFKEEE